MYLASSGNTQVYSPFGSYVVEQHKGFDVARRFERPEPGFNPTKFEAPNCPSGKTTMCSRLNKPPLV